MKAACIILSIIIAIAMVAIICMVKFATEISVEERKREQHAGGVFRFSKNVGVISITDNSSMQASERFPYVAAVMRNNSQSWSFSCFGSIILLRWLVTTAHCRKNGFIHRVLLFYDYARNYTHTYPILFWRLHEKFNISNTTPMYDIAVAKLNVDLYPYTIRPSTFDEKIATNIEASIWRTVLTMDKKMFLTNDFVKYDMIVADPGKCYETYGVEIDDSLMCVDMSHYQDCFVTEFGPVFSQDRIVGLLAVQPRHCEQKHAIFTNVSSYTNWILRNTHTSHFGKRK